MYTIINHNSLTKSLLAEIDLADPTIRFETTTPSIKSHEQLLQLKKEVATKLITLSHNTLFKLTWLELNLTNTRSFMKELQQFRKFVEYQCKVWMEFQKSIYG